MILWFYVMLFWKLQKLSCWSCCKSWSCSLSGLLHSHEELSLCLGKLGLFRQQNYGVHMFLRKACWKLFLFVSKWQWRFEFLKKKRKKKKKWSLFRHSDGISPLFDLSLYWVYMSRFWQHRHCRRGICEKRYGLLCTKDKWFQLYLQWLHCKPKLNSSAKLVAPLKANIFWKKQIATQADKE